MTLNVQKQYTPFFNGKNNQTKALLYSRYEKQKKASDLERQKQYKKLYAQKVFFYHQLSVWYKQQSFLLRLAPKNFRAVVRNALKLQKKLRQKELRERQAIIKRRLMETRFPTWRDWLHQQANSGNRDAVDVLCSMNERCASLSNNLLTAKTAQKTGNFLHKNLTSHFIKNGNIVYKSVDGGVVVDAGEKIHAQKFTTGSAYIALNIAIEKFKDQPLVLNGTEKFKTEVAQLAGIHGINAIFSDPRLNILKEKVEKSRESNIDDPIKIWLNKRNQYAKNLLHVMWNGEEDILKYVGRRRIEERSVLLFEPINAKKVIFIKEASKRAFIQAQYWKIGEKIKVTKDGYQKLSNKEIEI
ncbi:hypothetical protein BA1379B_001430 [Bartonella sp. A1379B]|uniref:LPD7 domain-containing protein n=2 Tax=unclassified Bartonella TaxID=2645622 RepID=UPI0009C2BF07|nr:LPD7 domain-containing protein [Bartonella sp. A1379B]AQX17990.1 hypothetical protein BA1379B_001430 [Bartonella sp. A1379B]